MRKRGFALHCDTVESYIELLEKSQNKKSYFYDSQSDHGDRTIKNKFNRQSIASPFNQLDDSENNGKTEEEQNIFGKTADFPNFYFDADINQEEQDEKKLEENEKGKLIRQEIAIILSSDKKTDRQLLFSLVGENKEQFIEVGNNIKENGNKIFEKDERKIDLRKKRIKLEEKEKQLLLNIWIVNEEYANQPLVQTYLNLASEIYLIGESTGFEMAGKTIKSFCLLPNRMETQLNQILHSIEEQIILNFN